MRIVHVLTLVVALGAVSFAAGKAPQNAEAAKLQNPVPATDASIAEGKKMFADYCAACHGDTGKGDGPMASYTGDPPPSNLTDAEWKHGSTDGEMFVVIRDGVEGTGMKDFKDMKPNDIWTIVNYVKTLAPKPAKNH